jgi:DNA-binding IclR family transcriptional regulator
MADQPIKSVIKALKVMNLFSFEKPYWGPRELAKAIHTSHSSAQRLLSTLTKEGMLTFSESKKKYTIGPSLWRLGTMVFRQFDFQKIVRNIIEECASYRNETFYLFSYQNEQLIFEVEVESTQNLRYHLKIGVPYEIQVGAAGKCIIANLPTQKAETLISLSERSFNIDTDSFREKIRETKKNGYSFTVGERVAGVVGFAAPIFLSDGSLYGGVLLTVPDVRFEASNKPRFGEIVKDCATQLSDYVANYFETPSVNSMNSGAQKKK